MSYFNEKKLSSTFFVALASGNEVQITKAYLEYRSHIHDLTDGVDYDWQLEGEINNSYYSWVTNRKKVGISL
jgi:hypothetical protein